jgi:hypothetical protein
MRAVKGRLRWNPSASAIVVRHPPFLRIHHGAVRDSTYWALAAAFPLRMHRINIEGRAPMDQPPNDIPLDHDCLDIQGIQLLYGYEFDSVIRALLQRT